MTGRRRRAMMKVTMNRRCWTGRQNLGYMYILGWFFSCIDLRWSFGDNKIELYDITCNYAFESMEFITFFLVYMEYSS